MKKKLISLLLVFALCMGISMTAMAAEGAFVEEYGMDLPESSYSTMWVGDRIGIDADSYMYEVLSGAENVKLDLANSSMTFIKAGTAEIKVTANGSGESTTYMFTVSPAKEAYVEYQIPQSIKVGYTVGRSGESAVNAPNAYVYHNCLLGSRYGGMTSMNDFYSYGFVSEGWGDPFFPDVSTRTVTGFWNMTFTRPGTTYIKIDDNGTKPYAITIEEPVINTNLPQEVQAGTAMQMTTRLDNTELEDKKIEEIQNRHSYDTKAALGYQPVVEIVSGAELVKRGNGDYSNILSSSENITFTGEGTVTFKVTYKMLPLEEVGVGESIAAGAEVLYNPEATFSVNVVAKEEADKPSATVNTNTNKKQVQADVSGVDTAKICQAFGVDPAAGKTEIVVEQKNADEKNVSRLSTLAKDAENTVLSSYDIDMTLYVDGAQKGKITEEFGKLKLSLYAGKEYAGKKVIVYQLHNTDEIIQYKDLTVDKNGMVTITVTKLSTFTAALQKDQVNSEASVTPTSTSAASSTPQTGDESMIFVWMVIAVLSAVAVLGVFAARKRRII